MTMTFSPAETSPQQLTRFAQPSLFGNASCGCHRAVANSQDLIRRLCTGGKASEGRLAGIARQGAGIEWKGAAADLFRQRLTDSERSLRALTDEITSTQTLLWQ